MRCRGLLAAILVFFSPVPRAFADDLGDKGEGYSPPQPGLPLKVSEKALSAPERASVPLRRRGLPGELRAAEEDVNEGWRRLYGEAKAYLAPMNAANVILWKGVQGTPEEAEFKRHFDRRLEQCRLLTGNLSSERELLQVLDRWLDSLAEGGKGTMAEDAERVERDLNALRVVLAQNEGAWAEESSDPGAEAMNRDFKEYDRAMKDLVLRLVRRVPSRSEKWTKAGEDIGLGSFRKMLGLVRGGFEPTEKAARALLRYGREKRIIKEGT